MLADTLTREQARKDLREYDNPKGGHNPNYRDAVFISRLEIKYNMTEAELREWSNNAKKKWRDIK